MVAAEEAGVRLDQLVAQRMAGAPAAPSRAPSRAQVQRWIEAGAVTVNDRPSRAAARVRAGDRVTVTPPAPAPVETRPEAIPLTVLHEDAHLLVVDKPAGLVVHPAAGHAGGTLVNALLAHCSELPGIGGERRPGIVHRLDKDTSGVLVVAKDDAAMAGLVAQFKERSIERRYVALVVGGPAREAITFRTLYGRDPSHRKKFSSRVTQGKTAVTHLRVLERLPGAALVECRLETGRTHQIRVHLSDAGFPVLGDRVYGRKPRDPRLRAVAEALGRQALHAAVLGFRHPITGETLRFETTPPADMQAALAALRAAREEGRR